MKIISAFLVAIAISYSCNSADKHKSAQEIYESGKIGDSTNFLLMKKDDLKVRDQYRYKYDTALIVQKDYYGNRQSVHVLAFYYNGLPEGKWTVFEENGSIRGYTTFKNGKQNGDEITYFDNGKIKVKSFYKDNLPQYQINYDEKGKMIDSVGLAQ